MGAAGLMAAMSRANRESEERQEERVLFRKSQKTQLIAAMMSNPKFADLSDEEMDRRVQSIIDMIDKSER